VLDEIRKKIVSPCPKSHVGIYLLKIPKLLFKIYPKKVDPK
jgi:hypothetical protein